MTQENDPIGEAIARLRERAERQGAAETGSDEAGPRLAVDAERHRMRQLEALLFAAAEPLDIETLQARLPAEAEVEKLLAALQADYAERGVRLVEVGGRWRFETAPDLASLLEEVKEEPRRLSDAGLETLAIIAKGDDGRRGPHPFRVFSATRRRSLQSRRTRRHAGAVHRYRSRLTEPRSRQATVE